MARPSAETIAKIPLFEDLEPRELARIADSFKERRYGAGETIASEGKSGAGFFVIGEGTASVTVGGDQRATLGPGDYFGEIALLRDVPRTAEVVATTDGLLYVLAREDFLGAVTGNVRSAQAAQTVADARLRASASSRYGATSSP
jgi:CRP-like cAMP-binding protein